MSTLRFAPTTSAARRIATHLPPPAPLGRLDALPRERARPALPSVVTTSLLLITPDTVADITARLTTRAR